MFFKILSKQRIFYWKYNFLNIKLCYRFMQIENLQKLIFWRFKKNIITLKLFLLLLLLSHHHEICF